MKKQDLKTLPFVCVLFASFLLANLSYAGQELFTFDGADPTTNGTLTVLHRPGTVGGQWYPTDGAPSDPFGTNGYFSITDGFASQRCTVLFPDIDGGLVVKAFKMDMDIRVGLGSAVPADGFSISYARANDPVLVNNDGTGYAGTPSGSETDLEEEGTQTGLSVCFDSWFSGVGDVIGITVRLDNTIITNVPMGVAHGGCTNLSSIQTDDTNAVTLADVCWTKLVVELTTNGLLNLSYKGATFLTNFPTSFGPSAGRLILAGRTGDNSQNAHVDNINIVTIPTAGPAVGSAVGNYFGFTMPIDDSGAATPNTNTLNVQLDGTPIIVNGANVSPAAVTITKSGITTTITYQQSAIFNSASVHSVHVTFSGTGFSGTIDETRNFVVPTYVTLPTGLRTPVGSGDATKPGFKVSLWQSDNTFTYINGWQNLSVFGEQQLAGLINTNTTVGSAGTNVADLTSFTNNGQYFESDVINYSGAGDIGSVPGDLPLPGLPGTFGVKDNATYAFTTFVEFPTNGLYRFGVQSDDGFKLTYGDRPGPGVGLRVLAPSNLAGTYFAAPTALAYGQAFGGALSTTGPLIRRAVVCDPPWPTAAPNNAAALAGNIAILHRDPSGGVYAHSIWAQNAGAVGVVVVDEDDQGAPPDAGGISRLPGPWGGGSSDLTVPVVTVEWVIGTNLLAQGTTTANSPIVIALEDDSSLRLGSFEAGRGAGSPTVFDVLVPQAGLYPLRLFYENGGGDASVELWTLSGGVTNLINSSTNVVKAYRARTVASGRPVLNPVAVSGNNVVISWTGVGELEEASSLTGPWFKSDYQNNPSTVPRNNFLGNQRFFRVRQY